MEKILITGTGRSGTSFLVHLLSALGMDTGYTEEQCAEICNNVCQAGAEHTIEKPYKIIKNPEFMLTIEDIVKEYDIEHVIIPIRNLEHTAKSRKNNSDNHGGFGGFCFDATNEIEQMENNAIYFFKMIEVLTRYEIPYTTIAFPRVVKDEQYLYWKLKGLFSDLSASKHYEAFKRIANINKITIK